MITKKEKRIVSAFINCVKTGEFSYDYACLLMEDADKYGFLTDLAKEKFYAEFETANEETGQEETPDTGEVTE